MDGEIRERIERLQRLLFVPWYGDSVIGQFSGALNPEAIWLKLSNRIVVGRLALFVNRPETKAVLLVLNHGGGPPDFYWDDELLKFFQLNSIKLFISEDVF